MHVHYTEEVKALAASINQVRRLTRVGCRSGVLMRLSAARTNQVLSQVLVGLRCCTACARENPSLWARGPLNRQRWARGMGQGAGDAMPNMPRRTCRK
jgi:hypothetical protein